MIVVVFVACVCGLFVAFVLHVCVAFLFACCGMFVAFLWPFCGRLCLLFCCLIAAQCALSLLCLLRVFCCACFSRWSGTLAALALCRRSRRVLARVRGAPRPPRKTAELTALARWGAIPAARSTSMHAKMLIRRLASTLDATPLRDSKNIKTSKLALRSTALTLTSIMLATEKRRDGRAKGPRPFASDPRERPATSNPGCAWSQVSSGMFGHRWTGVAVLLPNRVTRVGHSPLARGRSQRPFVPNARKKAFHFCCLFVVQHRSSGIQE